MNDVKGDESSWKRFEEGQRGGKGRGGKHPPGLQIKDNLRWGVKQTFLCRRRTSERITQACEKGADPIQKVVK